MRSNTLTPQGIGMVGLGSISTVHRTGYARYGLPVTAGFDVSPQARDAFKQAHPDARVYDDLDDLLADPAVEVIDVATPHHRPSRVPLVQRIAAACKPVFIQKPLAMSYTDALEMVEALEATGTVGMVNQNMCFTPGGRTLPPLLIDQQILGEPFLAHLELRYCYDCLPEHWFGKDERWWTTGLTVHHLGLLQLLFGPPERVYAVTGRDPVQPGVTHDGFGHLMLSYPSGLQVTMLSTGTYYGIHPKIHGAEELWVQGPRGIVDWQPSGGFRITLREDKDRPAAEDRSRFVETPGSWFPDAFGLGMHHFQQALQAGVEPLCSVQDNLYVMAVIEATYSSAASHEVVTLPSIMGERYVHDYGPGWLHGYRNWQQPEPVAETQGV